MQKSMSQTLNLSHLYLNSRTNIQIVKPGPLFLSNLNQLTVAKIDAESVLTDAFLHTDVPGGLHSLDTGVPWGW